MAAAVAVAAVPAMAAAAVAAAMAAAVAAAEASMSAALEVAAALRVSGAALELALCRCPWLIQGRQLSIWALTGGRGPKLCRSWGANCARILSLRVVLDACPTRSALPRSSSMRTQVLTSGLRRTRSPQPRRTFSQSRMKSQNVLARPSATVGLVR